LEHLLAKESNLLNPEFWPTVATVIPVLALAIVVEARAIISRWSEYKDKKRIKIIRVLQSILCILWVTPLILSIYLETSSFDALEGGHVAHSAVSLAIPTVAIGLAVLIIGPAIELLIRSNARMIALLLLTFAYGRAWWRWQLNIQKSRKLVRLSERNLATTYEISAELNKLEVGLRSFNDPAQADYVRRMRNEIGERRRSNLAHRRDMVDGVERARDLLERAVTYRGESKILVNETDISNLEKEIFNFVF
jgi:hypothetical protein